VAAAPIIPTCDAPVGLTETAYAKINLALHVRRRREDGYHELETLFVFLNNGDELEVIPSIALELELRGPWAAGLETDGSNLVLRAAQAIREHFGVKHGARILLDKRLPLAAGLGGGSADAAAAARLLNRFWKLGASESDLAGIIGALGADVPACLASRTIIGRGIGHALEETSLDRVLRGAPVLLVNPRVACPTGPVFAGWDGQGSGPLGLGNALECRNDLLNAAIGLVPEIGEVLNLLGRQGGVRHCNMSGSGATCFALFANQVAAEDASVRIAADHPGWWRMLGRLR